MLCILYIMIVHAHATITWILQSSISAGTKNKNSKILCLFLQNLRMAEVGKDFWVQPQLQQGHQSTVPRPMHMRIMKITKESTASGQPVPVFCHLQKDEEFQFINCKSSIIYRTWRDEAISPFPEGFSGWKKRRFCSAQKVILNPLSSHSPH